ncbi:MAG: glycosyltransferase family 39 protein [Patescibacteria group bacterium]
MQKIISIACLAFMLSLGYAFYYHDRPRVDAAAYDKIAWNLARGNGYVEETALASTPEQDWGINRVGPGYQLFLATLYSIFGHRIWVVWVAHAFLRAISVILVWLIARELMPDEPRAWFMAAIFFTFAPDLIVVSGLLLTETFFITLLLGALYATIRYFQIPSRTSLGMLAILWPVALLTRPIIIFAIIVLCGYAFWIRDRRMAMALVLGCMLFVAPWSYRMSQRYERFILTTGVGWYDVWVGNHRGATGGFEKPPEIQRIRDSVSMKELDHISRQEYVRFLTKHPIEFIGLQIRKTSLYVSLIRPGGFWIHLAGQPYERIATLGASFIWTIIIFVLGFTGAWILSRERPNRITNTVLVTMVMLPLGVIPAIVETRYRYALYPLLAISAAYAYTRRPVPWRVIVGVASILLVLTSIDAWYNIGTITDRITVVFDL